jgi:hypothetical protein
VKLARKLVRRHTHTGPFKGFKASAKLQGSQPEDSIRALRRPFSIARVGLGQSKLELKKGFNPRVG